ncbi:MAG: glutaredoxin 2 [Candidatus Azotimanducaceae bacterium]|jgi:glutaredoxin 2
MASVFALDFAKRRQWQNRMADDKQVPPADFSELVTEWERNINEYSNKLMGTPEFAKSMNQFQNVQMAFQKNFSVTLAQQLANFNMPSRDDVVAISEQLTEIDQRLAHIEKALARTNVGMEKPAPERKRPVRTKKPPTKQKVEGR